MGERLKEVHVIGTYPDGSPADVWMLEVQYGPTKPGATFTKWGTCSICLHDFLLGELEEHNGKLVCHRNGCYKDYLELSVHRGGK